jgi:hypothetical protein
MQKELLVGSGVKMWLKLGRRHFASLLCFSLCSSGTEYCWLWWLPKVLVRAFSVVLPEATGVGGEKQELQLMQHHLVPRTTSWVVGTCEAPLWGFPESCARKR